MANKRICYLTTEDNPWSPYTNMDEWFARDIMLGHSCCDILARVAKTSDSLTEEENNQIIEEAIDEIVANDFENIYKKLVVII